MAVKILIERKIKPGKEKEFNDIVKKLRSQAMHTAGFISGETLRCVEDPSLHLVISTWKSIEDWKKWFESQERKESRSGLDAILEKPTKMTPFQYE